MFRVSSICGSKQCHSLMRKDLSHPKNFAMMCPFATWFPFSVMLLQWLWGGMSSHAMLWLLMASRYSWGPHCQTFVWPAWFFFAPVVWWLNCIPLLACSFLLTSLVPWQCSFHQLQQVSWCACNHSWKQQGNIQFDLCTSCLWSPWLWCGCLNVSVVILPVQFRLPELLVVLVEFDKVHVHFCCLIWFWKALPGHLHHENVPDCEEISINCFKPGCFSWIAGSRTVPAWLVLCWGVYTHCWCIQWNWVG